MAEMILLAVALSFDCFSAGVSYGLKNMILPWYGGMIICGCSGLVLALSMLAGTWLGSLFSETLLNTLGAIMLILLGLYLLQNSVRELADESDGAAPLFQWEIARLGIMIQILKEPHKADMDRSGAINSREALWLGLALSLDSFGAGIGMAFLGYSPVITSLSVMLCTLVCLWLGVYWGRRMGETFCCRSLKLVPGSLMTLIGLIRLML